MVIEAKLHKDVPMLRIDIWRWWNMVMVGGKRNFVFIPKGMEGKGWKKMAKAMGAFPRLCVYSRIYKLVF